MKEPTAVLTTSYKVYVDDTRTHYDVHESGDSPQLTEIVQMESFKDSKPTRLVIENENLPKLIEALQRRLADCQKDPEA